MADSELHLFAAVSTGTAAKAPARGRAARRDAGRSGVARHERRRADPPRRAALSGVRCAGGDDVRRRRPCAVEHQAGATGYLLNAGRERIAESIHELRAGGSPISPGIARRVLMRFRIAPSQAEAAARSFRTARSRAGLGRLSGRESEILRLVARGLSFDTVGELLEISPHTVVAHVKKDLPQARGALPRRGRCTRPARWGCSDRGVGGVRTQSRRSRRGRVACWPARSASDRGPGAAGEVGRSPRRRWPPTDWPRSQVTLPLRWPNRPGGPDRLRVTIDF